MLRFLHRMACGVDSYPFRYRKLHDSEERDIFQVRIVVLYRLFVMLTARLYALARPSMSNPSFVLRYASNALFSWALRSPNQVCDRVILDCWAQLTNTGIRLEEKMQAISSPRSNFVREQLHKYFEGKHGIKAYVKFKDARANDFYIMAIMVMSLDKMPLLPSVHATAIINWLSASDEVSADFKSLTEATFTTFREIAKDPNFRTAFTEGARVCAPVELTLSVSLVATYKGLLSNEGLADAIRAMRADCRKKHADVRMNAQVVKTLHQFISNFRPDPKREESSSSHSTKKRKAAPAPESDSDNVKPDVRKKVTPSRKNPARGKLEADPPPSLPTSASTSQLFAEPPLTQPEVRSSLIRYA